jgi:CBS domain-containing protein
MSTSGEICSREVLFATRDMTVQAAAELMRHNHVGTIIVVDEEHQKRKPVGIVTDRDIVVEVIAARLDPEVIRVGDIMAQDLVTVRENDGLLDTVKVMRSRGVRRLPVVDAEGSLAGIISVDDLLETLNEQITDMVQTLSHEREREVQNRR